jgi:TRAP transporter TAXI family solute receptor
MSRHTAIVDFEEVDMKKYLPVWIAALTALIVLGTYPRPATPAAAKPLPAEVSIGTHTVGASYHAVGSGLAKVITEHSPIKVVVKPFAGPNAWMPLLNNGRIQLGVISGMDTVWAYRSGPGFPRASTNLRLLTRGNPIRGILGIVVKSASEIKTIADLKGKRVTSNYGGNIIIHRVIQAWLAAGGLTWNDVQPVPVADFASGLKAVREGRADATFAGSPVTAPTRELDAAVSIRPLPFQPTEKALAALADLLPAAAPDVGKGGYGILRKDTPLIQYPINLVATSLLSEEAAYEIVKALWENYKELQPIHPWLKLWTREQMFNPKPLVPYHPGSVKFFKEQGLWTPELERLQQKLLRP